MIAWSVNQNEKAKWARIHIGSSASATHMKSRARGASGLLELRNRTVLHAGVDSIIVLAICFAGLAALYRIG
jgi:hypothetical protein